MAMQVGNSSNSELMDIMARHAATVDRLSGVIASLKDESRDHKNELRDNEIQARLKLDRIAELEGEVYRLQQVQRVIGQGERVDEAPVARDSIIEKVAKFISKYEAYMSAGIAVASVTKIMSKELSKAPIYVYYAYVGKEVLGLAAKVSRGYLLNRGNADRPIRY